MVSSHLFTIASLCLLKYSLNYSNLPGGEVALQLPSYGEKGVYVEGWGENSLECIGLVTSVELNTLIASVLEVNFDIDYPLYLYPFWMS